MKKVVGAYVYPPKGGEEAPKIVTFEILKCKKMAKGILNAAKNRHHVKTKTEEITGN